MSADQVVQAVNKGARVVYVHGDTPLLVDRVIASAESWGLERCGLPAFNHGVWRCSDSGADQALVTARTVPMMAGLRVVVLREAEKVDDRLGAAIVEYINKPSPTTLFILTSGPFGKPRKGQKAWNTRLANAAKKTGVLSKIMAKDVRRPGFVTHHAGALGLELARSEVDLLIDVVGGDLGRLVQELEKLRVYLGGPGRVTSETISEVCSMVATEEVWELTRGIALSNADVALRALHRLLQDGQSPHYLLAMVLMQLRKVLQARQMMIRGASDSQVASVVRLRPAEVRSVRGATRTGGLGRTADVLDLLCQTNRQLNRHRAGSARVLEELVVSLCVADLRR